jgi:hypothetical protein
MRVHDLALVLLLTGCGREDAVREHLETHEKLHDIELRHTGGGAFIYTAKRDDGADCQGDAQADGVYLGCAQKASITSKTSCVKVTP